MDRRRFLRGAAAAAGSAVAASFFARSARAKGLTHKERVDRALRGADVDRPPFTVYHHYGRPNAQLEAADHLAFQRVCQADIVKVMNDFSYPKSTTGRWYELKTFESPYPEQLETLKLVRDGLNGDAYFIDTLYGPYMTAMLRFAAEPPYAGLPQSEAESRAIRDLPDFQHQYPDQWHAALEAITQSTLNHIRKARDLGASGALLSLYNTESRFGSIADYERFSRPYDVRVLDALADSPLTFLHLHNLDRVYLPLFASVKVPVVHYSVKTSGIPIAEARTHYSQVLAGGVDEVDFRTLSAETMRAQWRTARAEAGSKYIAAPGCSVPDDTTTAELTRFSSTFDA